MSMTDENGLGFIDTNVLLYAYDTSAGKRHDSAAQLVGRLGRRRLAATSVQVLQEFYVNATRKIVESLTHDAAVDRIRAFGRLADARAQGTRCDRCRGDCTRRAGLVLGCDDRAQRFADGLRRAVD
jgi:predicted nucleic acid-binding protein